MTKTLRSTDQIDTIRGYRSWHGGQSKGAALTGMTYTKPWSPTWTTAICESARHSDQAPKVGCNCGLYAWHLPDPLMTNEMFGVVEACGRILWAPAGFRAEKARIVAVYSENKEQRGYISRSYPGTALFSSIEAMLARFPSKTHPNVVYGPYGDYAQTLMNKVRGMSGQDAYDLDLEWATWGGALTEEYGERLEAHVLAYEILMDTKRQFGVRSTMRPVSQVVTWARVAMLAGDLITDRQYELLIGPWAKLTGDPLEGVRKSTVGVVPPPQTATPAAITEEHADCPCDEGK